MGADALASAGLQSGFVVAVVIAAVLLADRLGGGRVLTQRVAQVALGVALVMLVFSATTAFYGPQDYSFAELDAMAESDNQAMEVIVEMGERYSEVGTIHVGLGIILVALGVVLFRRLAVTTPALILGGVLLILFSASDGGGIGPFSVSFGQWGPGIQGPLDVTGKAREVARFIVLLVGVVLLAGAIHWRWERGGPGECRLEHEARLP